MIRTGNAIFALWFLPRNAIPIPPLHGVLIELVAPDSKASPIYGLMSKYRNTPYHLCFETEDISEALRKLKADGWFVFQEAMPAPAIRGNAVAFLMHRNAGMIELVETGQGM